jgi:magnesium-transporting ATPase (P-type)
VLPADHVELRLLLIAERGVEIVERGANILDRLQHRVEAHRDCHEAGRRGGWQGGRTGFRQVIRGVSHSRLERIELCLLIQIRPDRLFDLVARPSGRVGDCAAISFEQILLLVLTALLSAVPVALPATFTLAAALGARTLALKGVLLTRLSSLNEAAMVDVICCDKTGTLTRNELVVSAIRPAKPGCDDSDVLGFAALASSPEGQDPIDSVIRTMTAKGRGRTSLTVMRFTPFDPAVKMAEAIAVEAGREIRVVKGAPVVVATVAPMTPASEKELKALNFAGYRTIAVAAGRSDALELIGFIAFSDPPRADSAELLTELRSLGVLPVMITGDAAATAATVAREIGLTGPVCPPGDVPASVEPKDFAVYAGVFPEQKFRLVKAFQQKGHAVGMCGDGPNDAPALRQAQMGIAVSTATDVAKAAAGVVLTEPSLGGIVACIKEGRTTFQRILSYTLNSITKKTMQVLFLAIGLLMTGHAILTPLLMVLIMITGDFLGMSLTTDNVRPSPAPNAWRIGNLTIAGVIMGLGELLFCTSVFAFGAYRVGLTIGALQTLAFVAIVFGNQATTYTNRERRHLWSSRPQHLAPCLDHRRSPDRLDVGSRRHCNDAIAGMGGGLHACRCGRLRRHPGFREGTGFTTPSDHLKVLRCFGVLRCSSPSEAPALVGAVASRKPVQRALVEIRTIRTQCPRPQNPPTLSGLGGPVKSG